MIENLREVEFERRPRKQSYAAVNHDHTVTRLEQLWVKSRRHDSARLFFRCRRLLLLLAGQWSIYCDLKRSACRSHHIERGGRFRKCFEVVMSTPNRHEGMVR